MLLEPQVKLGKYLYLLFFFFILACQEEDSRKGNALSEDMGQGQMIDQSLASTGGDEQNQGLCRPTEESLESSLAFLDQYCGMCHQDPPQFGAPYPLVDFEAMLMGEQGLRPMDRAVARLVDGTMPPAGQPQPSIEEAQAFIDWASCDSGLQRMPDIGGFEVSKPLYRGPASSPQDTEVLEMLLPNVTVASDVSDQYSCYTFLGPSQRDADRSIIRIEPVIDDARVVHHIVLYETDGEVEDQSASDCGAGLGAGVYAWAPGQPALHFNEGGLITRQGQNYIIEIHYNNQARYENVRDQSGVRLFHSSLIEPQIDMITLGPEGFRLPARSRTEVGGQCEIEEEFTIIATMPHMHEIGKSLKSTIIRADQSEEDLITLDGWDFNYQLIYDAQETLLSVGDRIQTHCIFENPDDQDRRYGPYTDDEMCYNFIYVTPPPTSKRCDAPIGESVGYTPGECGPSEAASYSEAVIGYYREGEPPTLEGGSLISGQYQLTGLDVWFDSFDLGIAVVDEMLSYYDARGAFAFYDDARFEIDVQGIAYLISIQGAEFMREISLNWGGVINTELDNGTLNIQLSCPNDGEFSLPYSVDGDAIIVYLPFNDVVSGTQVMRFERVVD
uniref:Copper type II ascorbate-dependent monooxygenase C-terminal domain-containing protein n=1 Tax=uncultured delta proteobacterium HF0010_08B07 TaxID=710821 RepID=E0XWU7_9DELT|nr:hypothetical protein [uncultured delta proteobacterium HF0010_08B07]